MKERSRVIPLLRAIAGDDQFTGGQIECPRDMSWKMRFSDGMV